MKERNRRLNINRTITVVMVSLILCAALPGAQEISEQEQERKRLNEQYDRHNLRNKQEFVVDRSDAFLIMPEDRSMGSDFTVASVPPEIRMMIVPDLVPEYFPPGPAYMTAWAHWCHMTRSEDNRFFFSVSDHRGFGCQINLYEYSPARNMLHKVLDVDELLGWTANSYTDGKIHGYMGIMPDGTLWGATHFGVRPDSTWFADGYRGSWLFSYNINTHEANNYGVPLIGNNLPLFIVDSKRGKLVGTGSLDTTVLSWDCINKRVLYAGSPPEGWVLWVRSLLCDEETGLFWSIDSGVNPCRFLSFDPELNRWKRYDLSPPANPLTGNVATLRAHTDRPAMDGYYYWSTMSGAMFKFKPRDDGPPEVEYVGLNWDEGRDVLQFALDPSGRYIYYIPVGWSYEKNSPIVQYDVKTGKKKVICWYRKYYFDTYGYWTASSYALGITKDGSQLVFCMNGAFQGKEVNYGYPSFFVVNIPEEERPLD